MATAGPSSSTSPRKPLVPPEERFWKRYSPHYELPLASATALFAHGLIIGVLAIGGLAVLFAANLEPTRPANMDTLLVENLGLPGLPGGDGAPGAPGDPDGDNVPFGPPGGDERQVDSGPPDSDDLPTLPDAGLDKLILQNAPTARDDLGAQLATIGKDAENRSKTPDRPKVTGVAKSGSGTGGSGGKGLKGNRGQGGTGKPGGGGQMGFGTKATEQEIKARRWQFDLSGEPKIHADKIDKTGVILGVPDPKAGNMDPRMAPLLLITDVKRRPAAMMPAGANQFADAVKWYNTRPESIQGLAQELRLPFVPRCFILLLPKEREAKMAAEEARYAAQKGHDINKITMTLFDFRLQNGTYEPVVIAQH
jgi:hypothetical protein